MKENIDAQHETRGAEERTAPRQRHVNRRQSRRGYIIHQIAQFRLIVESIEALVLVLQRRVELCSRSLC